MCKGACVCICHVCGNQKSLLGALLEMLPLSFEAESPSGDWLDDCARLAGEGAPGMPTSLPSQVHTPIPSPFSFVL